MLIYWRVNSAFSPIFALSRLRSHNFEIGSSLVTVIGINDTASSRRMQVLAHHFLCKVVNTGHYAVSNQGTVTLVPFREWQ